MFKVIVERPRIGGSGNRKGRHVSWEKLPSKQSMKKAHSDKKSLNENLNPLKRFLNSKVGSHWDKVYSEICQNLKTSSTVQQHVRDHIGDFVFKNVFMEGKKVYSQRRYYGQFHELRNQDLYVCPKSGILKKYKIKNKTRQKYDPFINELSQFSNSKSKTSFENGEYLKLYFDDLTNDWTIKEKANKTHAKLDFQYLWMQDSYRVSDFLYRYQKRLNFKHPYWASILDMYLNAPKPAIKTIENPVGQQVEFSADRGSTWQRGIINRFEIRGKTKFYWISYDGKNVFLYPFNGNDMIKFLKKVECE